MRAAAVLSITFAPALRDLLIRGRIRSEADHPVSRAIQRVYRPFVFVALRNPRSTILIGLLAVLSAVPLALRLGHEFMPPLNEGDVLYMPTTLPNISIEEVKRELQVQDRIFRGFPEVASVFGKAGRADTATDPAPLTMIETTVRLKPTSEWRQVPVERWWSAWAPGWAAPALRRAWPDRRRITWDELTAEMNAAMQLPGWTNAFTMPIKARIDMLSTGVRTPVGIKVLGSDLQAIERVGVALEGVVAKVPGTRSAFYERNEGGLYVDVVPDRDALARHGLTVADVQRQVEAAIGGTAAGVTVDGRKRFSIQVRYPQDLRGDPGKLRRVLVPVGADAGGGGMGGGSGASGAAGLPSPRLASGMGGARAVAAPGRADAGAAPIPAGTLSDAPRLDWASPLPAPTLPRQRFVPLGEVADVRIVSGPPMVRDEGGLLVGYIYVDVDPARDVGGWVAEAKERVRDGIAAGAIALPEGTFLRWTGQYEHMEEMLARMKLVIPATILLIVLLLWLHFRNFAEVLIVLLSIPFALVGSVWLLWLLDYRLSTAVWVGIIAVVGLAAQTGIVMIVYIDQAYERRRRAGKIRDLQDIVWAHMEGTVQRVRPKLMTIATMLAGLVPLLWADGSGADVMKRIAAPMVGGLATSAFLTLEIIPVVYTYWRQEQVLWERLAALDAPRLAGLRRWTRVQGAGWALLAAALVAAVYVEAPRGAAWALLAPLALVVAGSALYLRARPAARALVWPAHAAAAERGHSAAA
jgi:Cu(I)/Ag(I) efflux system membrane protein CusA/SilA